MKHSKLSAAIHVGLDTSVLRDPSMNVLASQEDIPLTEKYVDLAKEESTLLGHQMAMWLLSAQTALPDSTAPLPLKLSAPLGHTQTLKPLVACSVVVEPTP